MKKNARKRNKRLSKDKQYIRRLEWVVAIQLIAAPIMWFGLLKLMFG